MKNIFLILILFSVAYGVSSCAKNATCDCTTKETRNDNGEVVSSEKNVYHNYGNDPTCNDWEDVSIGDSTTTTITCKSI